MNAVTTFLSAASILCAPIVAAPQSESARYHIVLPRRSLSAGETVELRLSPPPPQGLKVNWSVAAGAMTVGLDDLVYRAPFVIPVGTSPATVIATFSSP